jgi:hypothetical protein
MKLHHLKNKNIDREKWDMALSKTSNPLVYATSWYLDIVSPEWEAYVNDDFSVLIPLPVKSVLGLKLIIQPPFCQQLGLFSSIYNYHEDTIRILKRNLFATISWQIKHQTGLEMVSSLQQKTDLILPLQNTYEQLKNNFTKKHLSSLKKATRENQIVETYNSVNHYIEFSKTHARYTLTNKDQIILTQIIKTALKNGTGHLYRVIDNETEKTLCAGFFIEQFERIVFLSGHSSPEGFQKKSMFILLNYIIQKHAGNSLCLDFEGGKLSGVARFYRGFGAIEEPYFLMENKILKKCMTAKKALKRLLPD